MRILWWARLWTNSDLLDLLPGPLPAIELLVPGAQVSPPSPCLATSGAARLAPSKTVTACLWPY